MAVLTRSIQSGGGGDYTTIAAWEAAAPNLGTDIWKGEIDDDSEYNESVTFSNSGTPSATSYYWLTGGTNNRHAGVAGTGHPRVRSTSGNVFNVQEDFTRVEWLEVEQDSGGSSDEAFRFDGSDDVLVSHCIVYSGTPASDQDGFYCANNDSSITIDNCIVYGWNRSGVHFQNFGSGGVTQTLNLDHSTLHAPGNNSAVLIRANSVDTVQTVNMFNNAGASESGEPFADSGTGSPNDDPNGTVTWNGSHNLKDHAGNSFIGGTNNLTDWQSATDGITDVSQSSGAWLVVDSLTAGSESYLLKDAEAGNLAIDNGTDRQGSEPDTRQDFSVDITGGSRPTTNVDIGSHEFAAAVGGTDELIGSTSAVAFLTATFTQAQALDSLVSAVAQISGLLFATHNLASLIQVAAGLSAELDAPLSSTSLYATADGTIVDVVNESDAASPLSPSIDDDPASPDDNDWVNNAVDVT